MINFAIKKHKISEFYVLCSFGKDSITTADWSMKHIPNCKGVIATDTGVSDSSWKPFVLETSKKLGWNLIYLEADPLRYDKWVLNHGDGFPHAGIHGTIMRILKLDLWRKFAKENRDRNIAFISGRRKLESKKRKRTIKEGITKDYIPYISPLWTWTNQQVWDYINEYDLPLSPSYKTTHKSGDCECGAFAESGESELLWMFEPELAKRFENLEKQCLKNGLKFCKWGLGCSMRDSKPEFQSRIEEFGCSECIYNV